jgi:hypothetical protein
VKSIVSTRSTRVCASVVSALVLALAASWSTAALAQVASPATAAPAPPAKETASAPAAPERDHIGFALLGGVGFPRPLAVEALVDVHHVASFGVEYSALPTTNLYGVNVNVWAVAADVRIFPLRNAFFVGLRAGHQRLGESGSTSVTGVGTLSASTTVDMTFLNPRIGFLWTWHALAFGLDAGVQVPVSSSTSTTLPSSVSLPPGAAQLTQVLGSSVLPTVDLLQLGVAL